MIDEEMMEKAVKSFILNCLFTFAFVFIASMFFNNVLPMGFFDLFKNNQFGNALMAFWPMLAWGLGISILLNSGKELSRKVTLKEKITGIFFISAWAGIMEEIYFRWLLFFQSIIILKFLDYITLGILSWFYENIVFYINNVLTLGFMERFLWNPLGWFMGAAMIIANSTFREGHNYQGWIGALNSWVIGMAFFVITLDYGIMPAMMIHFLYDVLVFSVVFWKK